jgi:hypothetical protein
VGTGTSRRLEILDVYSALTDPAERDRLAAIWPSCGEVHLPGWKLDLSNSIERKAWESIWALAICVTQPHS